MPYPSTTTYPGLSVFPGASTTTPGNEGVFTVYLVIAVSAYTTLNSSFTSSFAVGASYQGTMRQLASDRWNYMYPS